MGQKIFVVHYCKNKDCNNCWIDEDLTNAKSNPPRWKYCKNCCEKYGYNNPIFPPKKKMSLKQLETIEKNKFVKRKKLTTVNENEEGGILRAKIA